jgi:hypothetical protein
MERFRLSQSNPKSQEELGGFAISIVVSAILYAVVYAWIGGPDAGTMLNPHAPYGSPEYKIKIPDPDYISPIMVGLLMSGALILFNASPIKRLSGFVQYLVCVLIASALNWHHFNIHQGFFMRIILSVIIGGTSGFLLFTTIRVNWWFYWDHPSRRSPTEKMLCSIFYTVLSPLGFAMGLYRLLGVGVATPTTRFIVDSDHPDAAPLETIRENPALLTHAERVNAVRSAQAGAGSGRTASADKESVSGSI